MCTLPEVVDVVPVGVVPAGQEPDVPLALRHALLVGLAHRHARRPLEELADDDAGAAPLQVLQVLQRRSDDDGLVESERNCEWHELIRWSQRTYLA